MEITVRRSHRWRHAWDAIHGAGRGRWADDSPASSAAVELAARLALGRHAAITIVPAPPRDPALDRAVAAGADNLLSASGRTPHVSSGQDPPERAIPATASALRASLVILGFGCDESGRSMGARLVGCIGCSVLAVPSPPGQGTPPAV